MPSLDWQHCAVQEGQDRNPQVAKYTGSTCHTKVTRRSPDPPSGHRQLRFKQLVQAIIKAT
jgi:hypothetical protein